jgi:hypothetical protein
MRARLWRGSILAMTLAVAGCGAATPTADSTGSPPAGTATEAATIAPIRPTPTPAQPSSFEWASMPAVDAAFTGARVGPFAAGSAGIVAVGRDPVTGAMIAWTSPDGASWDRHWLPPTTFGGGVPSQLVAAGQFGYLAVGFDVAVDSSVSSVVWTSPDGVAWAPDPDPSGSFAGEVVGVASGPGGIMLQVSGADFPATLRLSRDGRHWSVSRPANAGSIQQVAAMAGGFIASGDVVTTLADGSSVGRNAVWLSRDGLAWSEQPQLSRSLGPDTQTWFVGAGRSYAEGSERWTEVAADGTSSIIEPPPAGGTLAGGPAGVLSVVTPAIGSPCPSGWIRTADDWVALPAAPPSTCPARISVDERRLVPLADGWLVLGQAGEGGKTFGWLLRPGSGAVGPGSVGGDPAAAPASAIPDADAATFPRPDACPARPVELTTILQLGRADRVGCFGGQDLTFRAWIVDPGEGYGGTCPALFPQWLLDCVLPPWLLSADPSGDQPLHALRAPNAAGALKGVARWVRVTGHFDDPAAATCNDGISTGFVDGSIPTASLVRTCRTQFVVTRMQSTP